MFEEVDPAGDDAWLTECAAALDLIDESDIYEPAPEVTDAEFAAWSAELEGWSLPEADAVIRAGESEPVTPQLVAQLAQIDAASLDDDARVGLAVCWSRVANYVAAMLGGAVAAQVAATSAVGGPKDVVRRSAEELASAEIGAALHLGRGAADSLVF